MSFDEQPLCLARESTAAAVNLQPEFIYFILVCLTVNVKTHNLKSSFKAD